MQGVLIRIDRQFPEHLSWAKPGREGELVVRSGSLVEAAKVCENSRVTVLVPGEEVLLATARVPGGNLKRVAQAAPYAIEDQLADEIENLHFVVGEREGEDSYSIAVVARERMDFWLSSLAEAGIRPQCLLPTTLALPPAEGGWTVMVEGEVALLRTGRQQGFAVDRENLGAALDALRQEQGSEQVDLLLHDPAGQVELELPAGFALQRAAGGRGREAEGLRYLADQLSPPPMNLLQGDSQHRAEWLKVWQVWRPAALLALCVLLLHGGMLGWRLVELDRQRQELANEIREVYRKTIPGAKETDDPRGEMERRLKERVGSGSGGGGFLELLAQVGGELVKTKGYRLQTIKYKTGSLDLFLQVKDLESLDDLQARLRNRSGLQVDIKSAVSKDGDVKARLLIEEKGT